MNLMAIHSHLLYISFCLTQIGAVTFLKWQRTGTQGDDWNRGLVQLATASAKSRIVFEAIRGVSYSGDIAIDDISVLSGTCPPPGLYMF